VLQLRDYPVSAVNLVNDRGLVRGLGFRSSATWIPTGLSTGGTEVIKLIIENYAGWTMGSKI
jgi:hypothetical protein